LDLNETRDDGVLEWQWHQLDHMLTICTSLQTDNHTNTSSLNFYRPDALPDAQPTVSSTEGRAAPKTEESCLHLRREVGRARWWLQAAWCSGRQPQSPCPRTRRPLNWVNCERSIRLRRHRDSTSATANSPPRCHSLLKHPTFHRNTRRYSQQCRI